VWPAFVAYAVAFVLVFVATSAVVFAVALSRAHGRLPEVLEAASQFALSAAGIMTAALVSATVLATVTFVSSRLWARDVATILRLGRTPATAAGLAAVVAGMGGLSLAAGAAVDLLGWRRGTMAAIAHALERPTAARLVAALATIAIAPALAEEGFFRGLIQTRLAARWGRWPAIGATATGFGLFHLDPAQSPVALLAGLFLGWVAERFGGIRPGIFAHAFNNAAFVAIASLAPAVDGTGTGTRWTLVLGSAVFCGSIVVLRSRIALARSL
jgi:membrane protease YdiL (CAAX protease family)